MPAISLDLLSTRRNMICFLVSTILVVVGALYLANGFRTLESSSNGGDLGMRWKERGYLMKGINPYDVSVQFNDMQINDREHARIESQNLVREEATLPSGYPPWGLSAAFVLLPPGSLDIVKPTFAAASILALLLTAYFAFDLAKRYGTAPALLIATAIFAMFGNASTLRLGQYGLILNFFLILAFWLSERRQGWLSGIPMAVIAIKPSFSLYQFVVFLLRWRWKGLLVASVICLGASCLPWLLTGVDPVEMTLQMLRQSSAVSNGDTGLLGVLRLVIPQTQAVAVLALVGLLVSGWVSWRFRAQSFLVSGSIAAIAGRLCLYHRQYDNVMLMLPLLAIGLLASATGKAWAWALFAIYAATLLVPIPFTAYTPMVAIALAVVWTIGGMVICRNAQLISDRLRTV